MPDWRFGPVLGWQSNSTFGFSTRTWNYGGFAERFATPDITGFAKLGGFSGNASYSGFYASGAIKWYPQPDVALNGGIDYTHSDGFGGSDEEDYTLGGEYLFPKTRHSRCSRRSPTATTPPATT